MYSSCIFPDRGMRFHAVKKNIDRERIRERRE